MDLSNVIIITNDIKKVKNRLSESNKLIQIIDNISLKTCVFKGDNINIRVFESDKHGLFNTCNRAIRGDVILHDGFFTDEAIESFSYHVTSKCDYFVDTLEKHIDKLIN